MIANQLKSRLPLAAFTATIAMLAGATGAQAVTAPVKEVLTADFGAKVNTSGANVCAVSETCQPALVSSIPGGFEYPDDVAGAPNGNVYVADRGNLRVQELEADGKFVLMFGREVNETAHLNHETANENVCPVKVGDKCKAGVEGVAAGQFIQPNAVAVDPMTKNVYVAEFQSAYRVDEYTSGGQFVLMFGWDVNKTKEKEGAPQAERNVCTAASENECQAGKFLGNGTTEHGAFVRPKAVAVGPNPAKPAEYLLYVGDEHRVQEFKADGTWAGQIPLTSVSSVPHAYVSALAVDQTGDVYLVYEVQSTGIANIIHEFDPSGVEVKNGHFPLTLGPREESAKNNPFSIVALALDSAGRLAVSEYERVQEGFLSTFVPFGSLYSAGTGELITEFRFPPGTNGSAGMAFNGKDELYAQALVEPEILAYKPLTAATLVTTPAACIPGTEHETDVTENCALNGEVDSWGVEDTQVWFEWGRTAALGKKTTPELVPNAQPTEGVEEVPNPLCSVHEGQHKANGEAKCPEAVIEGVRPNESSFYYRLGGENHNVKAPEGLNSYPTVSFKTSIVAPRIVGEPIASFETSSSAVMFGEVNPENTKTKYFFEYGPCVTPVLPETQQEACAKSPYPNDTATRESGAYGKIGTTVEVTGLQPVATYHYRLVAVNEKGQAAVNETGGATLPEGTFTTASALVPQATTGGHSQPGTTSATVSGTVNPDGQPATYAFELGIYNGASTQYGVVFSGSAGASTTFVEETLALTGLQPGTTYAYRIVVKSGYGTAYGATETFTTAGLPSVLVAPSVLAQLPVPNIPFPKEPAKVTPKKLTRAQKLALALKACTKKPASKRAACRRSARAKYAVSKKARKSDPHGKGAHKKRG
jgi:hypothetical protein